MFGCREQHAQRLLVVLQAFGDQLAVDPVALLGLGSQGDDVLPWPLGLGQVGQHDADVLVAHLAPGANIITRSSEKPLQGR